MAPVARPWGAASVLGEPQGTTACGLAERICVQECCYWLPCLADPGIRCHCYGIYGGIGMSQARRLWPVAGHVGTHSLGWLRPSADRADISGHTVVRQRSLPVCSIHTVLYVPCWHQSPPEIWLSRIERALVGSSNGSSTLLFSLTISAHLVAFGHHHQLRDSHTQCRAAARPPGRDGAGR